MTVKAIYENGVFRPIEPVSLPERAEVEVIVPVANPSRAPTQPMARIYEILSRSYDTGRADLAERHNEHRP
jgi:predicted DNA-binding antitoxin AbrB/MazE fold protein